jgi:hypothetical protein
MNKTTSRKGKRMNKYKVIARVGNFTHIELVEVSSRAEAKATCLKSLTQEPSELRVRAYKWKGEGK